MRSFENRIALSEVLDNVHRQTVVAALGSVGVALSGESWQDIQTAVDTHKPLPFPRQTYLDTLEYIGSDPSDPESSVPVGTLFGEECVLTRSGRIPSLSGSDGEELGEDKYRRRIEFYAISNNTFPDFTSIYLLHDVPPIAVYSDTLIALHTDAWEKGEVIPETEIIEKLQKAAGSKGIEYVSEEMAKRVIFALRNEKTRLYNTDLFFES